MQIVIFLAMHATVLTAGMLAISLYYMESLSETLMTEVQTSTI